MEDEEEGDVEEEEGRGKEGFDREACVEKKKRNPKLEKKYEAQRNSSRQNWEPLGSCLIITLKSGSFVLRKLSEIPVAGIGIVFTLFFQKREKCLVL